MIHPIGLSQNYIFIHKDSYCLPHREHDSFLLKEPLSRVKWLKEYTPRRSYKSIRMQHKKFSKDESLIRTHITKAATKHTLYHHSKHEKLNQKN